MTKTQVEVITSVQRRRSWSRSEKERIVTAVLGSMSASYFVGARNSPSSRKFRRRLIRTPEPESALGSPVAAGHTDMRKGFDGLALLVQETLKERSKLAMRRRRERISRNIPTPLRPR
jgi:hypothetical protein